MKAAPEKATAKERGTPSEADGRTTRAPEPVSAPMAGNRGLDRLAIQRLQGAAGNAAVSRLVAQRYAEVVTPPPAQAPGFREVTAEVAAKKQTLAQHPPAAGESKAAQDAAVAPPDDKQAQGKAAQAEKMNAAKPGEFDKAAFIKAVNDAIAAQAPKNLDEADKFSESGKAEKVKEQVDGKVGEGKESSAKDIETTTAAAPDTSAAKEKPVTPMTPDKPPGNPGAPSAEAAIPAKQPAAVTDFSEGPKENDKALADADVTEEQLAKGNEPEFNQALSEKKKAEEHSAQAPAQGRAAEDRQLTTAKANAAAAGTQAMASLTATRTAAGQQVDGGKGETKSKDERKRAEVTARLRQVFDETKKDVEGTLSGLDKTVDDQFTRGEKAARDAFMADQERRMKAYKKKRYSGFTGKLRWVKDKFKGLPEAANQLYQESRRLYVQQMQGVISGIADTIGAELGKAKARIAKGRAELKAEVDRLPADLRQFGEEAAADFAGKFDDLESEVNEKSQQLVQELATKYTQALNKIDEEIKKLQEANKGLIDKAKDAIVGVIKTINELKNLLMGILAKAAGAIMKIIKDPIGFLGNLVQAVGAGLNLFIGNIADHLEKGLVSWLLGTAVKAGLELPAKFDLKGIIRIIGSLLGLTWDNIRTRVIRKGVPDQAMSTVEQQVPVAQAMQREGPAGASKEISAHTGDLKGSILQKLKSYLIPTVLIAGITWIVSLLNPASAFVRAVKGIIDIVTFIVNQGAQVVDFVNAVLDAVVAIANGAKAGVPKMVEGALAASLPLLIGFLAALVGVGGLANKVKQVFHAVSRPVNRAIDKIVDFLAKAAKRLWNKPKGDGSPQKEQKAENANPKDRRLLIADLKRIFSDGTSGRELEAKTESAFARWNKRGLKSLEVIPRIKHPGLYGIYFTASPRTHLRALPIKFPHQFEIRDFIDGRLYQESTFVPRDTLLSGSITLPSTPNKKMRYSDETHAIASLYWDGGLTRFDKTGSSNGKHAEHQVVDDVKSGWDSYVTPQPQKVAKAFGVTNLDASLDLSVTRSPCPKCASRLGRLRKWGMRKGWNLEIAVHSIGLYHASRSNPVTTDSGGMTFKFKNSKGKYVTYGKPIGMAGLEILRRWGIRVSVLTSMDPTVQAELAKMHPADRAELAKKIASRNRGLANALTELASIPATRIRKI